MAIPSDISAPCLRCGPKCLNGFKLHKWRSCCLNCGCDIEHHDVVDERFSDCLTKMGLEENKLFVDFHNTLSLAKQIGLQWLPLGIKQNDVDAFLCSPNPDVIDNCKNSDNRKRARSYRLQIPLADRSINFMRHINNDEEKAEALQFIRARNSNAFGIGWVDRQTATQPCADCKESVLPNDFCVRAKSHNHIRQVWHTECFKCNYCRELLVDNIFFWHVDKIYCERHYAQLKRPRCAECDELIFSEEYTKAMDQDHHLDHFACQHCDRSLTGERYILKDEQPHCLACYEQVFANQCANCQAKIECDSKDLCFKERHWHERCFCCSACSASLVDRPFATRDEVLFCADCYDEKFAARCDACHAVFRAGMRKFEYRGKQWHEECFQCADCRQPIGAKSFIPKDQLIVCVPCYEEKHAQRCSKCKEVIRRGGVTYKGEPWHKECFTCGHCSKQLAGVKFISKEEKPFCGDCYGELFAKKCCKCARPITGIGGCKFISFEDRHWHSECFTCSKCDLNLVGKGFLTTEDKITCPECGR